jgi:hypothetical protein
MNYKIHKDGEIQRTSDGAFIPRDEGNSDYRAYLAERDMPVAGPAADDAAATTSEQPPVSVPPAVAKAAKAAVSKAVKAEAKTRGKPPAKKLHDDSQRDDAPT